MNQFTLLTQLALISISGIKLTRLSFAKDTHSCVNTIVASNIDSVLRAVHVHTRRLPANILRSLADVRLERELNSTSNLCIRNTSAIGLPCRHGRITTTIEGSITRPIFEYEYRLSLVNMRADLTRIRTDFLVFY